MAPLRSAIISGMNFIFLSLSRPAGRDKHIFTQGAVSGNCCFKMIQLLTAAALPVKVRSRKVRRLSGIAFYKNFTAMIARAKRRQF